MKKFLIYIGIYLILAITVFLVIELLLLYQPNTYSYKREYLEKHINEIEILLMGNSYIEEGVRPDLVGNHCFNLAISGRDIVFDSEIARKYFLKMDCLKVVVMPLDYSKFEFGRGKVNPLDTRKNIDGMTDTYRCMHYKYMHLHIGAFWLWSEIWNSQLNYMSRFWQSRQECIECDSLGYIKLEFSKRGKKWEYRALPPIIDISKQIDENAYSDYYKNYSTIARYCQQKNVILLIINTPKAESYRKEINDKVMCEITQFIYKLQTEYSNVRYIDYTFDDFEQQDYNDACHLSDCGAIKFSKKLKYSISLLNI